MHTSKILRLTVGKLSFDPLGVSPLEDPLAPSTFLAEGVSHQTDGDYPVTLHISRDRTTVALIVDESLDSTICVQGDDYLSWNEAVEHLRDRVQFYPGDLLDWAIGCADPDLAAEALEQGADPNEPNAYGLLPLDALTISAGCRANAMQLLFESQGCQGATNEASLADKLQDLCALEMIRLSLLTTGSIDQTPFREAVRENDLQTAGEELGAGARVDALTLNRVPLLVERIQHQDEAGVRFLLEHGADPLWRNPVGGKLSIPVHIAAKNRLLRKRCGHGFTLTPATAAVLVQWEAGYHLLTEAGKISPARVRSDMGASPLPDWLIM